MTVEPNYIKNLERENEELKKDLLRAEAMEDYWKIHSSELIEENAKLKDSKYNYIELYKQQLGKNNLLQQENQKLKEELYYSSNKIIELQMQLYDAQVFKNRLTKILNETSDYT